jgi:hypothetical protein
MSGALAELIARLEAATGPTPHLDAEIEAALRGGEPAYRTASRHQFGPSVVLNHGAGNAWDGWESAPSFTGSLDAALTLVPEIWRVYALQEQYIDPPHKWFAGLDRRREHTQSMIGKAPTPALALCIAALRARAESKGQR